MKKDFLITKSPQELFKLYSSFPQMEKETVFLEEALGRVLAEDISASEDLPGFKRATMDGYAVKAKDTFGASESAPIWLKVIGEVKMGEIPEYKLNRGEAVKIYTGGMLPEGADAVLMLEYTQIIDEETIEVLKPVAPLENIILADEDFKKGELILKKGHRLRPQDIGVFAAFGLNYVLVYKKPTVAIISTGDEVVPITKKPKLGEVRDVNTYTLSALVKESGGIPLPMGLVKDDLNLLKKICKKAIESADMVLLSGGSSIGIRDFTLEVISSFPDSEILCHGVAISPGKPTIFARVKQKAIWGLPGQITSAIIVFMVLVKKFLQWISGETEIILKEFKTIKAKMEVNIASAQGREDYIRVKVFKKNGIYFAKPILGKSGLINTLIKADGLIKIDLNAEGLDKGEEVEVILF